MRSRSSKRPVSRRRRGGDDEFTAGWLQDAHEAKFRLGGPLNKRGKVGA